MNMFTGEITMRMVITAAAVIGGVLLVGPSLAKKRPWLLAALGIVGMILIALS